MSSAVQPDPYLAARQDMVESQLRARGICDQRVLAAMACVPRHEFVDESHRRQAYDDHPLPIGDAQTISQPYIVAITIEALALEPSDTVLEIGTGSGYQTAVLARLCKYVYTVERLSALARQAQATLCRLGVRNVTALIGDGSTGVPEFAPYDAIAVAAAAPRIPAPLFEQLREGGRMVIPVGPSEAQALQLVRKQQGSQIVTTLEGCRFVPLLGDQGYSVV